MKNTFKDGKIIAYGKMHEEVLYNVSNEKISAAFDGKGTISYYAVSNQRQYISGGFLTLRWKNKIVDVCTSKSTVMQGRCQKIYIELEDACLYINQFVDKAENGIFTSYELVSESYDATLEMALMYDIFDNYIGDDFSIQSENFYYAADSRFNCNSENKAVYLTLDASKRKINTFLFCGEVNKVIKDGISNFDLYYLQCEQEINDIKVPDNLTEKEKAMYYSTYFCALENYKVHGDYKAFMAGCNYLLPMRSYYRDSYFTVLSMYNGNTDKIRNQIITLAKGVSDDGSCPSAVKFDYTEWWGNHYDSPSFFAMMLYDYIKFTGDMSVADEDIAGKKLFLRAVDAVDKLSKYADDTGLLYKSGKYNKCDWADEVNRCGYVTYDELMYARSLYSISNIFKLCGDMENYKIYDAKFKYVKKAINDILWDEKLGYYINFKNEYYTETNLSIDIVFAAIFGIADDTRAKQMLTNMERLLETRNNHKQMAGDFGVMCVYPFYGRIDSSYFKSAQPYNYHNGADWPYLSAMYAYAKRKYGMEYKYALERWFDYNIEKSNYTPVEYFSSVHKSGSLLQAWSGDVAFVLDEKLSIDFWD